MINILNFLLRVSVFTLLGIPVFALLTLITFLTWDFRFFELGEQAADILLDQTWEPFR